MIVITLSHSERLAETEREGGRERKRRAAGGGGRERERVCEKREVWWVGREREVRGRERYAEREREREREKPCVAGRHRLLWRI